MIGNILANRYRIDSEIGHGGMGVVYRAYDTFLKRMVAIKVISGSLVGEPAKDRLLSEARAVARLNHPNIVTVYDAVEYEDTPFIVEELADGGVLRFHSPPGMRRSIEYVLQICAALAHAHANGIIHRDIKPDNVLLTSSGIVKLTDFGLAHNMDATQPSDDGSIVGTLAYLAPEIIQGAQPSPQSDLYALGVLLYELLTGELPFKGADIHNLLNKVLFSDIIPPAALNAAIPTPLNDLVVQLIQRSPDARPSAAQVVTDRLVALLAEEPGMGPNTTAGQPLLTNGAPHQTPREWDKEWRRKSYPKTSVPMLGPGEKELILSNREKELSSCRSILDEHRLLVITGMPGIGKSTLARVLLELMPENLPPPFWYDFDRQKGGGNSLGIVLDRISAYLEKCLGGNVRGDILAFRSTQNLQASANDVDTLTEYLNQDTPVWLVFDNIETVLAPGGNGFLDEGLDALFDGLKTNPHNAKIIITSPLVPVLRDGELLLEFGSQPLTLQGLDEVSAVTFLRANGLEGFDAATLSAVVKMVEGHPFALKHLARYISAVGIEAAQENLRGGLDDFLEHFQTLLRRRLSGVEYSVLKALTVLQREISIEGLCKTAQTRPAMVKRLREAGLLEKNQVSNFWLPTLVRLSLAPQDPDETRPAHQRALEYYRKLPLKVSPKEIDDYANVLEWNYHAVQIDDGLAASAAILSTGLSASLMQWNEYSLLARLCEQTLMGALAEQKTLAAVEWVRLNHILGVCDFYLGQPALSERHLRAAVQALAGIDDPLLHADVLIALGESQYSQGKFDEVARGCEQIFALLVAHPDDFLYAKAVGLRGIASRMQGKFTQAAADLEKACAMFVGLKRYRQAAYMTGELGILYYYLNQFDSAVEAYRRLIQASEKVRDTRGVMVGHQNTGDVYLQQGLYAQACEEFSAALELARKKKLARDEIAAGLYLAEAQIARGLFAEAQQGLDALQPLIAADGAAAFAGHAQRLTAALAWRQGRLESAGDAFDLAFTLLQGEDGLYERARALIEHAAFLRQIGQPSQARAELGEAKQDFEKLNNLLGLQAVVKAMASQAKGAAQPG
jgi:serine/threonine protein kinase/tetratricopeptide (TPR) repeat protein